MGELSLFLREFESMGLWAIIIWKGLDFIFISVSLVALGIATRIYLPRIIKWVESK